MIMRKVLFIIAFFAVVLSVNAQVKFGVKAGFNASTISGLDVADEGETAKVNYRPGFHVGVMAQYMMSENFGLESGLYYTALGANVKYTYDSDVSSSVDLKVSPSYLQLPVSLLYKFNVGQDLYLYPSLGLYVGYGIGGKYKFSQTYNGTEISAEEDIFGKDDDGDVLFNRFDAGATVGLNLQFNKFLIGLGYDYGLLRVNKEKAGNGEKDGYNRNIKVSVGYFF